MKIDVSTDPERVEELRRFGRESDPDDPLERFFNELPESVYFGAGLCEMLRRRRGEAVPRLLEAASDAGDETAAAVNAVVALCVLEEPRVLPIARRMLGVGVGPGETYAAPRLRIFLFTHEARFLSRDPEICRHLLAGLDSDDPARVEEAVQECGVLGVPGAVEKFAALIRRRGVANRGRLAFWIGQHAPTRGSVDLIGSAWLDVPTEGDEGGTWFLCAVAPLAEEGPPEVRRAAAGVLARWLSEIRDGVRTPEVSLNSAFVGDAFDALRVGDAPRGVGPVLGLIRARHPLVWTHLHEALAVLAAGDPALHRAECLAMLEGSDDEGVWAAIASLGRAYAGTADAEIVAALRAAEGRVGTPGMVAEALSRVGGAEAVAAAEAGLNGCDPSTRMQILWRTRGLDLGRALARLQGLGVLPADRPADALAAEARAAYRYSWGNREPDPAELLLQALAGSGVLTSFDCEADVVPPPHDMLVRRLGEAFRGGALAVEATRQVWNLPPGVTGRPDDEQRERSDYTVEFLHAGRVFSFRAAYFHDYYDSESVTFALNAALAASGRPERLHALRSGGQEISLLLLTPSAARVAREELFLPVLEALGG